MINSKSFFILFLLLNLAVNSQEIGSWKSYNSMNDAQDVQKSGNIIWVATTGGAYFYDLSNNDMGQVTPSDGLSSPLLNSLTVDETGKVWFATQQGTEQGMLNAYDPSTGLVKRKNDILNSDYTQKNINDLSARGDTVFISTDFGLSLIDVNSYTFFDTFIKFGQFPAISKVIATYVDDKIYAVTDNGLAIQKSSNSNLSAPESWISYQLGIDIQATENFDVIKFRSNLYLGTNNGIFIVENDSSRQILLEGKTVTDLFVERDLLYIIATENNTDKLFVYDGNQLTLQFDNTEGIDLNALTVIDSDIFAASSNGLMKISGSTTESILPNGPKNNSFVSIDVDNDGKLWVATGNDVFGVGIFSYDGSTWQIYDDENTGSILSNSFHVVYAAPDNTKYVGNWGRAFGTISDGVFTNYYSSGIPITGIPADPNFIVINGFDADSEGNIWMLNLQSAANEPLSVLTTDDEIFNFEFDSPRINSDDILRHLVVDQYDTKWFVVFAGATGLYYFNENGTLNNSSDDITGSIRTSDGLSSNAISALALDNRGSLWVGTNLGVNIIPDPSRPTFNINSSFALRQQSVNCIAVDALNRKWVGTLQGVFLMSEDGTFLIEQYNTSNSPLPTNDIKSIAIDDKSGTVYFGTDLGLTSLQTSSIEPVDSFNELFVYPNPVRVNSNSEPQITIDGLVENSKIKILSVTGKLMKEIESPGGKIAFWDGKDESGNFVSSGIYIIVAYDEEGSNVAKSKVAIVRE